MRSVKPIRSDVRTEDQSVFLYFSAKDVNHARAAGSMMVNLTRYPGPAPVGTVTWKKDARYCKSQVCLLLSFAYGHT
jgi:hypothetical protein